MKADEIRKIVDASNRELRELSRILPAQKVQAEAVNQAAQWLAEIAAQLAELNEARSRVDTFKVDGVMFRRDAIISVGTVKSNGFYNVEYGHIGSDTSMWFNDATHPRAEFIRAWRGE